MGAIPLWSLERGGKKDVMSDFDRQLNMLFGDEK